MIITSNYFKIKKKIIFTFFIWLLIFNVNHNYIIIFNTKFDNYYSILYFNMNKTFLCNIMFIVFFNSYLIFFK